MVKKWGCGGGEERGRGGRREKEKSARERENEKDEVKFIHGSRKGIGEKRGGEK